VHATAQPCRHTISEALPAIKWLWDYTVLNLEYWKWDSTAQIVWWYCAVVHLGENTASWRFKFRSYYL